MKTYHILIQSKKEKFFMRMFLTCVNLEEKIEVIHLMYENNLSDLASTIIHIMMKKSVDVQTYIDAIEVEIKPKRSFKSKIKNFIQKLTK